jgi:hypothetical protein
MTMTINRLFIAFMCLVGAAVGIVLVLRPESRDFRVPPYFWVLIAMALFELIAFARGPRRCWYCRSDGSETVRIRAGDRADGGDPDRDGLAGAAVLTVAGHRTGEHCGNAPRG